MGRKKILYKVFRFNVCYIWLRYYNLCLCNVYLINFQIDKFRYKEINILGCIRGGLSQ